MTKELVIIIMALCCHYLHAQQTNTLPVWQEGYLDIHHIFTGKGNAAFMILPDGTTLLVDAGDMDVEAFNKQHTPMRGSTENMTDTSFCAGNFIADYIRQIIPAGVPLKIDYAVITHFHSDHYGAVKPGSKWSVSENYRLTGITAVGSLIPIHKLIDRAAPTYSFPVDLKKYYSSDATFQNYLSFIDDQKKAGLLLEGLMPGSNTQIVLVHNKAKYPAFEVRNVKANGTVWTGRGNSVAEVARAGDYLSAKRKFNENPMSLALKISYGAFDYFTGGDNTGMSDTEGMRIDMETPIAKAVGQTDAITLDHHGNRDATNDFFVNKVAPAVAVEQSWCSDHPGLEVAYRLLKKDANRVAINIFATYMDEHSKTYLGPDITKGYKSTFGHVVIRVIPGGKEYYVFVLDAHAALPVIVKQFGPYLSN